MGDLGVYLLINVLAHVLDAGKRHEMRIGAVRTSLISEWNWPARNCSMLQCVSFVDRGSPVIQQPKIT